MAIQFRPTRNEVSRAFPVLGFTVRTGAEATTYEMALATDPALLRPAGRERRTRATFWSSRSVGRLAAARGESVFLVPQEALARFAGQDRLYYGVAVFTESDPGRPEIFLPPEGAAPFVVVSRSFTGQSRRLGTGGRVEAGSYGNDAAPEALTWAADQVAPGTLEPVTVGSPSSAANPAPGWAPAPAAPASAAPTSGGPAVAASGLAYSDGLGDRFWAELEAEVDAGDTAEVGPIPDEAEAADPAVVQGLDTPTPEDPYAARFAPAATSNYRVSTGRTIRRIVLHITDGGAALGGTVGWFQNPKARVSAHYVIGRDGEIVQMVRHEDVAWHAGRANGDSIGIEHVANTRGLTPTQAQYEASARLVAWLCDRYGVQRDRAHVLGHAEADSGTTHTACPNAVWDWPTYMGLLTGGASAPAPVTQALESALDIYYDDVELVPQPTDMACWAAAATMVYGWKKRISLDPTTMATECRRINQLGSGLPWAERQELAQQLGLTYVWPQSYSLQGFYDLLHNNGPLYVGRKVPSGHAVCVIGLHGDGTAENTEVIFHDPWPPGRGAADSRVKFLQFMAEYESGAAGDANTPAFPQIMHGNGRRTSAAAALGLGYQGGYGGGQGYAQPHANGHNGNGHGSTATLVRAANVGAGAAAAAVGAGVSYLMGNAGDVTWNLAQYGGPHHPGGNARNAGRNPFRRMGPITVRGPRGGTFGGADQIYADFDVTFEVNDRSIGSVSIAPSLNGVEDAAGAALDVRTTITPILTELPGPARNPAQTMAAIDLQFQYAFTYSWASNTTGTMDVRLKADGTYDMTPRW